MKLSILATCILAGVMFMLAPTATQANPKLVFTEISDTTLTATLDGVPMGTVNNVSADHWEWRSGVFGNIIVQHNFQSDYWTEVGTETGVNYLRPAGFDANQAAGNYNLGFDITSDLLGYDQFQQNLDGEYGFTLEYRFDSTTVFSSADVYFSDLGDQTSNIPDSSPTLGMLSFSALLLFGASKLRLARA